MKGILIDFEGIGGSGKSTQARIFCEYLQKKVFPAFFNTEPTSHNVFGKVIRRIIEHKDIDAELLKEFQFAAEVTFPLERGFSAYPEMGVKERGETAEFIRAFISAARKIIGGKELTELDRQLIFIADSYYDFKEIIEPALRDGKIVVQDRLRMTSVAYWCGSDKKMSVRDAWRWQKKGLGELYRDPHLTLFIEIPASVGVERLQYSGKVIDRYERLESLERIDDAYTEAIDVRNKTKWVDELPPLRVKIVNGLGSQEQVFERVLRAVREELNLNI